MKISLPKGYAPPVPLPFNGEEVGVTSRYFTACGKPVIPVMGELHFSRYPAAYWREALRKMKAGGVGIAATYIFWIHHEEIRGEFDWAGQRDLWGFINACKDVGMPLLLRIGPWAHGECRNGGFPDWLSQKKGQWQLRSNDARYLAEVEGFYGEIARQVEGLLWKDGGPVIGIQIENEYGHCGGLGGEAGKAHMHTLKQIAISCGFDVPFYTATGWGGAVVVEGEMLPVMGAYVDAPWAQHTGELPANDNFIFSRLRNDEGIGTDLAAKAEEAFTFDPSAHPYATAELGAGLQVTSHRRTVVPADDAEAMILCKLGSGANLIGYYMFHGGTNPRGKRTTLQESRATGYPNDLPELSYDFQAPLGEFGEMRESYQRLRKIHLFLSQFGHLLADSQCKIPPDTAHDPEDLETLRCAVRYNQDGSGFLFVNNHQRHRRLSAHKGVIFEVDGIVFPPMDIPEGFTGVFPFRMVLGDAILESTNAQPLCRLGEGYVFFADREPVFKFAKGKARIHVLTREEADRAFWHQDKLYIADGCLYVENDRLVLASRRANETVRVLTDVGWEAIHVTFPKPEMSVCANCIHTERNGAKRYALELSGVNGTPVDDIFLCMDFEGDQAELFMDGGKVSDRFYTGLPYEVGLKRFLPVGRLELLIQPLRQDTDIYLERFPAYVEGVACSLTRIHLESESVQPIHGMNAGVVKNYPAAEFPCPTI